MSRNSTTQRLLRRLRRGGWRWAAGAVRDRVFPPRLRMRKPILRAITGETGLEVGGPSRIFGGRGLLPMYAHAKRVDNVNFAARTAWEENLRDGAPFMFHRGSAAGTQWIREAGALAGIADEAYDFVLSSHCLEHLANPLGALREWQRVVKPGGHVVIVVPDPQRSFDHRRPVTTLDHLRSDWARKTPEDDSTHFSEVLALHDLSRDPDAGSTEDFRTRVAANATNRCVHHHVFDLTLLGAALTDTGWSVLARERARPVHLIAWAQKEAS